MADTEPVPEPSTAGVGGCLIGVFWLIGGPLGLVGIAGAIALEPNARVALSAGFWLLVLLMVAARYVDIVKFRGTKVDGEPASKEDSHGWTHW